MRCWQEGSGQESRVSFVEILLNMSLVFLLANVVQTLIHVPPEHPGYPSVPRKVVGSPGLCLLSQRRPWGGTLSMPEVGTWSSESQLVECCLHHPVLVAELPIQKEAGNVCPVIPCQ